MKLLVLGSRGQLGHDLIRRGRERRAVETLPCDRASLDLTDRDRIEPVIREAACDAVINCAAYHGTDRMETAPGPAFAVNAHGVEAVAEACRGAGIPLVHISTDYVFPGDATRPYRETDAPGPLNVYGASKLVGERLALRAHPGGVTIVRTASLFGAAGYLGGHGNFIETVLSARDEGRRLRVVDDIVMSPTSTADLAGALLDLLEGGASPGTYHLVNGGRASWYELARAAAGDEDGSRVERVTSEEYRTPARRPPFSVLDAERAAERGIRLRDWREALEDYLAERAAALGGA